MDKLSLDILLLPPYTKYRKIDKRVGRYMSLIYRFYSKNTTKGLVFEISQDDGNLLLRVYESDRKSSGRLDSDY